ncbi:MAG: NnrU family protein [Gemmatimonadota bacterium]|jgi:poly(3-hydroxybutyrate) depolymerase/protein-S-isoprenylcysteine O-methyltransferase Ste14
MRTRRIVSAAYGVLTYLAFLLPVGYLFGFLADLGVPKTVDRGAGPLGPALAVDLALLLLFGIQHSVMARPAFKRTIRRWIPDALERSTYVLVSGLTLAVLYWFWRPVPAVLWDVTGSVLEIVAWVGFALGWALAVAATFALSHLHLFGVAQVRAFVRGDEHPRMALRRSVLYRLVRHPMTAGLVLAFWCTPRMTVGHLVFAAGMTVYSLLATVLEEHDLLGRFPERYRAYRARVPALVPLLRPGLVLPGRGGLAPELLLTGVGVALATVLCMGGTAVPGAGAEASSSLARDEIRVGGRTRSYAFFDPSPSAGGSRPLVLALHGTGGSADRLRSFLGGELERVAAREGWLVAYPEAFEGVWNGCRLGAGSPAREQGVDDVAFLRTLVGRLVRERGADPDQVFLVGYSGGGHMAFRVALEAPRLAGGIAVFAANLPVDEELGCETRAGAVPVLLVNGMRDLVNPWDGGDVVAPDGRALGRVRSSAESVRFLEERNGGVAEVALIGVEDGGHTVPGPAGRFPALAGRTDRSREGIGEAVAFFARHVPPVREDRE